MPTISIPTTPWITAHAQTGSSPIIALIASPHADVTAAPKTNVSRNR